MDTEAPTAESPLAEENITELSRLKSYFPFRIVFGVVFTDGHFEAHAATTRRLMNRFAREGHTIYEVTRA